MYMIKKKQLHDITIITVTYNSLEVLPNMLSSISPNIPVIIVDNNSENKKELRALSKKYHTKLIENETNLGFGSSCNIGASYSKTKYLLFLNPDTQLDKNTIKYLLNAAKKYPNVSAMNPRIIEHDNSPFFKRRSHLLPRSKWQKRGLLKKDSEVSILSGSALFVKTEHFKKVHGFDQNIFLFHEDDDLCLRLNDKCGKLMYINDAVVKHFSGTSSIRSNKIAAFKAWHMGQSKIYTIKKHNILFGKSLAIIHSLLKLLSPESFLSKRRIIKNYSFLKSILFACIFNNH